MPIHRIPRVTMHEDIRSIERQGERITSVAIDGDHLLVVTKYLTPQIETRGFGTDVRWRGAPHPMDVNDGWAS